jgi:hypothetical protein
VCFNITLDVVSDDYRGPFAQGGFTMFRRAKLRLNVSPDDVAAALRAGQTVEAALRLTGTDGGLCAPRSRRT